MLDLTNQELARKNLSNIILKLPIHRIILPISCFNSMKKDYPKGFFNSSSTMVNNEFGISFIKGKITRYKNILKEIMGRDYLNV